MTDTGTDAPADTTDDSTPTDTPTPPETGAPDPAAELEKWKHLARENEKRAKANEKARSELEKLQRAQMNDSEKALAEAETRGRQAAITEFGTRLAAAEIKAALGPIVTDPKKVAEIIDDLNLAKYVTDSGEVDAKAVEAIADRWGSLIPKAPTTPKVPTGPRGDGPNVITSRTQLQGMAPDEIVKAHREGRIQIPGG
jgi:hypothetical protein